MFKLFEKFYAFRNKERAYEAEYFRTRILSDMILYETYFKKIIFRFNKIMLMFITRLLRKFLINKITLETV
jgi:hypothetical protein